MRFQQSSDGGNTFLDIAVQVDKPGLWEDNPDLGDQVPNTHFRSPNTVAMAWSPTTGTLAFIDTKAIRGQGQGDIEPRLSTDDGATCSDPIPQGVNKSGGLARSNQSFPWRAVDQTRRS